MTVMEQELEPTITTSVSSIIRRPSLLRSPPSTQLTTYTAKAHPPQLSPTHSTKAFEDPVTKKPSSRPSSQTNNNNKSAEISRTQHKLMLQRQSFLADDKNYLDHPDNMRRLTKELDRVNREYRYVKQYQDPFALSLKRVMQQQQQQQQCGLPSLLVSNSTLSSAASSWSSTSSQHLIPPRLQRRASSHTVHDYLMNFKEERRHSLSQLVADNRSSSPGFIGRIFGSAVMHHPPLSSSQLKRHPHVA
jgi:hypothetical protein